MGRTDVGRLGRVAIVALAALAMSGCASFSGMPRPVMPLKDVLRLAKGATVPGAATTTGFGLGDALAHAVAPDSDAIRREYRNAFVGIQIAAIDAQYLDFRERLSVQAKTTNFGLDVAILAVTGTGAVVGKKAANILSAGGSGLTGAKASFNREVYFDKALPALIASMDARRLAIKTEIVQRLQQPIGAYPIAQAIADLSAYQMAASLDGAIDEITKEAVDNRDTAQAKYNNVVNVCHAEDGIAPIWTKIVTPIRALTATDKAKLDKISDIVGSARNNDFTTEQNAVIDWIGTHYCSKAAANALLSHLALSSGVDLS